MVQGFGLQKFDSPEIFGGPGGFRKVRDTNRNDFISFSSKSDLMVPNYEKTKQVMLKRQRLFQCEFTQFRTVLRDSVLF